MSERSPADARRSAIARCTTLTALAVALLAGCGGDPTPAPPPPPAPPASVTISGTAATGAAIAGAAVNARCAIGGGSATTAADGSYTITIASAELPCVVQVAPTGATPLHGLAIGSTSSVVAQITPLTQLLVANAAAADPATWFVAFDAAAAARLDAASIASSRSAIVALLAAVGVDIAPAGDLLTATLRPGVSGDAYDAALLALAGTLTTAGTTLPELTQAVVTTAIGRTTPDPRASLPAELLLRPATTTCAAARSGRYRLVTLVPGGAVGTQFGIATFDATNRTLTRADGGVGTWTPNGNCRFNDSGTGWSADIVVTAAGVWFGRYSVDGGASFRPLLAIPEQTHTVAELAGTWQQAGMSQATGGYSAFTGSTGFDAAGTFVSGSECRNDSTWSVDACSALNGAGLALFAPLQSNADGGFEIRDAATLSLQGRVFAYRAGGGYMMLVGLSDTGFSLWTPQTATQPPEVGTVAYNVNINVNASLASPNTEFTTNTVTAVDTAAGSWTRTQQTVGAAFSYVTTLFANRPRAGLVFRGAATVIGSNGTTVTLNEFTFLRLNGMGFSPVIIPAPKLLQFSGGVPVP